MQNSVGPKIFGVYRCFGSVIDFAIVWCPCKLVLGRLHLVYSGKSLVFIVLPLFSLFCHNSGDLCKTVCRDSYLVFQRKNVCFVAFQFDHRFYTLFRHLHTLFAFRGLK